MSNLNFWNLLDYMPFGVTVFDSSRKYIYVNDAYCAITHFGKNFFIGTSVDDLRLRGLLQYGEGVVDRALEKKNIVYASVPVIDKTGHDNYSLIYIAVPIFDEEQRIKYIMCIQERKDDLLLRIEHSMKTVTSPIHLKKSTALENDSDIIMESPQMKNILSLLDSVAPSDIPVLLQGESGSGKEVLASYIYKHSNRSSGPFIILNCGAIPETLIESELFGYEKGAFSGALNTGKIGLFEAAHNGTLFLDEINSMPLQMQTRLLRTLENKRIMRIGSTKEKPADFRLICSTNEDLPTAVAEKRFRKDLYYRINAITVNIPSLSERPDDIEPLIFHFFSRYLEKYNLFKLLAPEVVNQLAEYSWPGNVRELKNTMEKIVITSPHDELTIHKLRFGLNDDTANEDSAPISSENAGTGGFYPDGRPSQKSGQPAILSPAAFSKEELSSYMDYCEKTLYTYLCDSRKSVQEITDILKINRSTVYRKLKKYNLLN